MSYSKNKISKSKLFLKRLFYFMCRSVLTACMYVYRIGLMSRMSREGYHHLEMVLHMAISHHFGAGNEICVLCKYSKYS